MIRSQATPEEERAAAALRRALRSEHGARAEDIRVVRSPFRACPLGAHVDHQLGVVTGFALSRSLLLAFAPSASPRVRLRSLDFAGEVSFDVRELPEAVPGCWGNYARGALAALQARFDLREGLVGIVQGLLPVGGVSSSSAVGVAYLLALEAVNGLEVSPDENVRLDQQIENGFLGLQNGILDQSMILFGKAGKLLWLDCRTRERESIPLGGDASRLEILVVHSGLSRALIGTSYNRHVAECREAAALLLAAAGLDVPENPVLGVVPDDVFRKHTDALPEGLAARARHFIGERQRVEEGVQAWRDGDLVRFGALMTASGRSSIENYRCGSPEIIDLHRALASLPGVHGTRFSGAGYGGCAIALVEPGEADRVSAAVAERYLAAHPERRSGFAVFRCASADGASFL